MADQAKVSIANFGIGNISSIKRLFEHIGVQVEIAHTPEMIADSEKLILPGVGAFDAGMAAIESGGWTEVLAHLAFERRIPILGICLGMQLLCRCSEEGTRKGLGWIPADVVGFRLKDDKRKVPHMGWSTVVPTQENPLLPLGSGEQRFYHMHRYHVVCDRPENVIGTSDYGYVFASAVRNANVFGVQFHPEKSHSYGMGLLKRFSELEI